MHVTEWGLTWLVKVALGAVFLADTFTLYLQISISEQEIEMKRF